MRTIAIDTSHPSGSVAALVGTAVATRPLGASGEHAKRIVVALDEATGELGWRLADIQLIVVVTGPGSFTGLRVGVTAAKIIAWACGAKLVGVCGFEIVAQQTAVALAAHVPAIQIAFDAGRGEVYAATATRGDGTAGWRIGPRSLLSSDAWLASLPPESTLSGPAMVAVVDRFAVRGHRVAPSQAFFPSALSAAPIGVARAAANDFDDPASLIPSYLRLSYVEEKKQGRD
jgi:tRNA threonylcarbamoyladenosine biosynthesis protein TsaB